MEIWVTLQIFELNNACEGALILPVLVKPFPEETSPLFLSGSTDHY